MFRRFTKKRLAVVLGAIAALAVAGSAFAYLTATGSGGGSGTATAASSAMTYTTSVPALTKLGDSQSIAISASQTGSGPQAAGTLNVSVAPNDPGCGAGSFTLGKSLASGGTASNTVASTVEVPNTGTATNVGSDTVYFNDLPSAQDTCVTKGYTITVNS
jgi:hypothetical protein